MKKTSRLAGIAGVAGCLMMASWACGQDLDQVRESGVLRHLSIPYANFNSGAGDGLDVELMQMFAKHLGVRYEYVPTTWSTIISSLTGQVVKQNGQDIVVEGVAEITGDVVASGFTVLPWREKAVAFSKPTFPTQVWLIAPAESELVPIVPTGELSPDIAATRKLITGSHVMGKSGTCLDLSLYNVEAEGATGVNFEGGLNDLVPALLAGESELLLLDVPDALVALNKWPGKIKVLGPMSGPQNMAAAFRPSSPKLLEAFNVFYEQCQQDGSYLRLVHHYYPDVFAYYPEFFRSCRQ